MVAVVIAAAAAISGQGDGAFVSSGFVTALLGTGGIAGVIGYLGGRKLGPIVIAMSTEASDMSSWLLMGVPGLAYFCGLADASWTVIGLALGTYLNWLIVAKRLRIYSQKLGAITIPDFFAHRFGDKSGLIEGIAALIIIIFFVPYTASGFAACGKLFTNLFPGSSYIGTMLLSAAVIVGYCAMGGFLAASITSLIQSIVMTIALFVILIFGIHSAGGWDAVIENAKTVPGYLDLFSSTTILSTEPGKYGFISIVSTMAWGLGYFGMPHILNHFMAIDDGEKLKISRRIGSIWVVISMSVAIIIGIVGFAMSSKGVIAPFESNSAAEAILVRISALMSTYGVIPALLAGVVLAGILSSTMSTSDAQLLAAASGGSATSRRSPSPVSRCCASPSSRPSSPATPTALSSASCPSRGRASARPSAP